MSRLFITDGAVPGARIPVDAWRKDNTGRQSFCMNEAQALQQGRKTLVTQESQQAVPPVITSPLDINKDGNHSFTYQIVADNAPTSFAISGWPPGTTVSPTGLITCSWAQFGDFVQGFGFGISATNLAGTTNATLTIHFYVLPAVSPISVGASQGGGFLSASVFTFAHVPIFVDVTGLPAGITWSWAAGSNSFSITFAGSSNAPKATYPFTIIAMNPAGSVTVTTNQFFLV